MNDRQCLSSQRNCEECRHLVAPDGGDMTVSVMNQHWSVGSRKLTHLGRFFGGIQVGFIPASLGHKSFPIGKPNIRVVIFLLQVIRLEVPISDVASQI